MPVQRATNLELQKWIVRKHGFVVESACLDMYRQRLGTPAQAEAPPSRAVPPEQQIAIEQAFRYFGIIP